MPPRFHDEPAGREDDERTGGGGLEEPRAKARETTTERELKRESVAQGEREREGGR